LELGLKRFVKQLLRGQLQANLLRGFGSDGRLARFPGNFIDWNAEQGGSDDAFDLFLFILGLGPIVLCREDDDLLKAAFWGLLRRGSRFLLDANSLGARRRRSACFSSSCTARTSAPDGYNTIRLSSGNREINSLLREQVPCFPAQGLQAFPSIPWQVSPDASQAVHGCDEYISTSIGDER